MAIDVEFFPNWNILTSIHAFYITLSFRFQHPKTFPIPKCHMTFDVSELRMCYLKLASQSKQEHTKLLHSEASEFSHSAEFINFIRGW